MLSIFKDLFGKNKKGNYVWCILPEYYYLQVITKAENNWLKKKKHVKTIDNYKFMGNVKTNATLFKCKVNYKFQNSDYKKEYGCTSKFTLIEFESKDNNFDYENVIIQICKNNVPLKYFRINLKNQKSRILLFSDFDTTMTKDLNLFEKKIILIKASFKNPKMIPYINENFEKDIFLFIINNFHRESFQKNSKIMLEWIFKSKLHLNLTNTNYGLFFAFLSFLKFLISLFVNEDPRFKTQFNIFRKKLEKYINANCKNCIQAFYKFEMETIGADIFSNDLSDILKLMYQCANFDDMENVFNLMKKIDYKNIKMDSDDTHNILFYYFYVQRKIKKSNEDQYKTFQNFTKEINKFEGKIYLITRS